MRKFIIVDPIIIEQRKRIKLKRMLSRILPCVLFAALALFIINLIFTPSSPPEPTVPAAIPVTPVTESTSTSTTTSAAEYTTERDSEPIPMTEPAEYTEPVEPATEIPTEPVSEQESEPITEPTTEYTTEPPAITAITSPPRAGRRQE